MARIRTLKPDAIQHRKVGKLSDAAFRLWVGMLTQADDEGRLVADPEQLRVLIFGYHPKTTTERVAKALREIATPGLVRLYSKNGTQYADFPSWADHQRIKKPTPSRLPSYESFRDESHTPPPLVPHSSPTSGEPLPTSPPPEGKGREGKGKEPPRGGAGGVRVQGFGAFWTAYPRKKSKGQAERAWNALQPNEQLQGTILSALERAKTSVWSATEPQYVPYPATWLRAKGWEDEIPKPPTGPYDNLPEARSCKVCGGVHEWKAGKRLEPCAGEAG